MEGLKTAASFGTNSSLSLSGISWTKIQNE